MTKVTAVDQDVLQCKSPAWADAPRNVGKHVLLCCKGQGDMKACPIDDNSSQGIWGFLATCYQMNFATSPFSRGRNPSWLCREKRDLKKVQSKQSTPTEPSRLGGGLPTSRIRGNMQHAATEVRQIQYNYYVVQEHYWLRRSCFCSSFATGLKQKLPHVAKGERLIRRLCLRYNNGQVIASEALGLHISQRGANQNKNKYPVCPHIWRHFCPSSGHPELLASQYIM